MLVARVRGTHHRGAFRGRFVLSAGLAAVLFWGTGCGGRTDTAAPTPAMQARPRSTAVLAFVTPSPGAVISGTTLHVRLKLTGAEIIPQTSTNLSPDKGHIPLALDGQVISMAYGVEQDVTVTPGPHILQAEFVATDHFPFNPRVLNTVTFTVR